MNPLTLLSTPSNSAAAQRLLRVLPGCMQPRALVGSLLLAAVMAITAAPPLAQAQAKLPEQPLEQQRVNINTADATILSERLTGIGRARAEAIVRYRETYGPFES